MRVRIGKYNLIGCLALVLWASSLPFIKRCSEDIGPLTTGAIQFMAGGIIGVLANLLLGKLTATNLSFLTARYFYLRCALFSFYSLSLYFSLGIIERAQLPLLTLINYLWPMFTMLLSVWILKQHAKMSLFILGSIIVFVGMAIEIIGEKILLIIASLHTSWTALAVLTMFIAAFTWASYTVLNRLWGERAGTTIGLPFVLIFVSLTLWCLRFAFHEVSQFTPGSLLPLAYLMITPYLANVCWDIGTRKGNLTLLSLLADGLPWASLTVAAVYLGINIDSKTWISAVLIVSGALISRYSMLSTQTFQQREEETTVRY